MRKRTTKDLSMDQAINYKNKYEIEITGRDYKRHFLGGYSLSKKVWRAGINMLMVLSLVAIALFGGIMPAQADDNVVVKGIKDAVLSVACPVPSFNATPTEKGVLQAYTGTKPNIKQTAFERYGMEPIHWTSWLGASKDRLPDGLGNLSSYQDTNPILYQSDCVKAGEMVNNLGANNVFNVTKFVTWAGITVYHSAVSTESSLDVAVAPKLTEFAKNLKEAIYYPYFEIMIIIAIISMAWRAFIQRKQTDFFPRLAWTVIAPTISIIILNNPALILDVSHSVKGAMTERIVNYASEQSVGKDAEQDNFCAVTPGDYSDSVNAMRVQDCTFWKVFVYNPWALGQFGSDTKALEQNIGAVKVQDGTGSNIPTVSLGGGVNAYPQNLAVMQLETLTVQDGDTSSAITNKQKQFYRIADAQLGVPSHTGVGKINSAWAGHGDLRNNQAWISLAGAVGGVALLLILSMSMIMFEFVIIFLMFMFAFVGLAAIIPGWGQTVMKKWFQKLAFAVIYQIVITFYLCIILIVMNLLMSTTANSGIAGLIGTIAMSIAAIKFRHSLSEIFSLGTIGTAVSGTGEMETKLNDTAMSGIRRAGGLAKKLGTGAVGAVAGGTAGALSRTVATSSATNTRVAPKTLTNNKFSGSAGSAVATGSAKPSVSSVGDAGTASSGQEPTRIPVGSNRRVAPKGLTGAGSETKQVAGGVVLSGISKHVKPADSDNAGNSGGTDNTVMNGATGRASNPMQGDTVQHDANDVTVSEASPIATSVDDGRITGTVNTRASTTSQVAPQQDVDNVTTVANSAPEASTAPQASTGQQDAPKQSFLPKKTAVTTENHSSVTFTSKVQGLPTKSKSLGLPTKAGGGTQRPK